MNNKEVERFWDTAYIKNNLWAKETKTKINVI